MTIGKQPPSTEPPGHSRVAPLVKPLLPVAIFLTATVFLVVAAFSTSKPFASLSDPDASQIQHFQTIVTLQGDQTAGQSFVSRRAGLNSILLWLSSETAGSTAGAASPGKLKVALYHSPQDPQALVQREYSTADIQSDTPLVVQFPALDDPAGQAYYVQVSSETVALQARGRNEEAYPAGNAFSGRQALPADLGFRTTYAYTASALLADVRGWLGQAWLVLPLALVLLLPGWLVLDVFNLRRGYDGWEQAALALGLSLALIPLALLWSSQVHLNWTQNGVRWALGLLAALAVLRLGLRLRPLMHQRPAQSFLPGSAAGWLMALVFGLSLILRLAMARDLATPAWVDSVHHGLITRLILENGSLPTGLAPFIDIAPTDYHPGFHAVLAAFLWLSGLEMAPGMLLFGQVLNAFSPVAAYLLTVTLGRNQRAGLLAALIVGLVSAMPAYYTSWGRYTHLAGLLIVPACLALFLKAWRGWQSPGSLPKILAAVLAASGLFLVHYRVMAFLLCLLAAYGLAHISLRRGRLLGNLPELAKRLALLALPAALLVLPWLLPTLADSVGPRLMVGVGGSAKWFGDFSWHYLTAALGNYILAAAGAGLLILLVLKPRLALTVVLWVALMFLLANLSVLNLPGGSFINNSSVAISLFLPLSLLAGQGLAELACLCSGMYRAGIHRRNPLVLFIDGLLFLLGAAAALHGTRALLPILNPDTILTRSADLPAIAWAAAEIPADETVLVNPFSWGYGIYAGSDGGYWLAPLAGLQTLPPPVLYGSGDPQVRSSIVELAEWIANHSQDVPGLCERLRQRHIQYIFVGSRGGPLSPRLLRESGLLEEIYAQNGVFIFRLNDP